MDKRKTLKVSITPDTSIIHPSEETLIFQTPRPKLFLQKNVTKEPPVTVIPHTFNFPKSLLLKLSILPLLLFSIYFYSNKKIQQVTETLNFIYKQNEDFKDKFQSLESEIVKREILVENYATIEKGAFINYEVTSPCHRYGLFGYRVAKDPVQVLMNINCFSECFSFTGDVGAVGIVFSECIYVRGIMIVHPITRDRSSALREFEVYGIKDGEVLLGRFCYDITEKIAMKYEIDSEYRFKEIVVKILNNHGKMTYTSVYSIRVYGSN